MKIDASEIVKLADFAAGCEEAIKRAEYRSVNKVTDKTHTEAKRKIVSMVNLTPTYVGDNLTIDKKASPDSPVAVINGRFRPTKLFTYAARVVTVADPKARGVPSVGIPAGQKLKGVSVGVKRGGAKAFLPAPKYFLLKLKFDNGIGIFSRPPGAKLDHHYGPSVDQGFRLFIDDRQKDVTDDLEKTFKAQLEYELKGLK